MSLAAIIPHMTSNNAPAPFIASTSNQLAAYAPFNAFQDNTGAWISDVANSYIQINLGRPYKVGKVFIDSITPLTGGRLRTFTLQASIDGLRWTDIYSGPTTNDKYTAERNFGVYQYWRLRAVSSTSHAAVLRYFQLYGSPAGFADLDITNVWVSSNPVVLKGKIYGQEPIDVRVLINDTVADDWYTFNSVVPVEYEYDASMFKEGGNVITVETRDRDGDITEKVFVAYKLDLDVYRVNQSSYDFKIKNSPVRPSHDPWVGQTYAMDYLNSESGISYIFRYKPYANVDSRIDEGPRLFERLVKENMHTDSPLLSSVKAFNENAVVHEYRIADIGKKLDAIAQNAIISVKEISLVQRIFDAWASINGEDIGIKQLEELAIKKIKISEDMLERFSLNARKKNLIKNALTMVQGYELSTRKTMESVTDYYRIMDEFYPYKETIIGGLLINAGALEKISSKYPYALIGHVETKRSVIYPIDLFSDTEQSNGILLEYQNADRVYNDKAIVGELVSGIVLPRVSVQPGNGLLLGTKTDVEGSHQYISFANTTDSSGTKYDTFLSIKDGNKESYKGDLLNASKNERSKDIRQYELIHIHKNQKTKEFRINSVEFIEQLSVEAYIEHMNSFVELLPASATSDSGMSFVNKTDSESHLLLSMMNIDGDSMDARIINAVPDLFNTTGKDGLLNESVEHLFNKTDYMVEQPLTYTFVEKMDYLADEPAEYTIVNKTNADSLLLDHTDNFFEKSGRDIQERREMEYVNKENNNNNAMPISEQFFFDKGGRDIRLIVSETLIEMGSNDTYNYDVDIRYVDKDLQITFLENVTRAIDKITKEALVWSVLANINALDKATIIQENWDLATKLIPNVKDLDDLIRFGDKEDRFISFYEDTVANTEDTEALIIEQLLLDHTSLNGYIMDLMGAEREVENIEGIKRDEILSDREKGIAIIQEVINTHRESQEKEAYIPKDTFVLAGDGSEWEDIWNRYSPGVDILDPPDSDYDYAKLAPAIYDPKTGVPHSPVGPSNKADVFVKSAMSHPIPENSTVGVDDTKRIAVDNYIFIDFVLALESIKNRQKLRYAGMPVGKAVKEVFSQLYTWIQQAAPGHKEYERMFRFSRWYAEAVVLRNSKQILHRVYNPWQSSLHTGNGLGIDHAKPGWTYMTGTGTLETTTLSAHLIFEKENYIDSEFVLRGYFDNPAGQGTIEISIDGVVVDSFSSNGIYERKVEIPQGHHKYDIFFYGTSGNAVISSIEIGGTNFVSAHTTSDDSDVNGLKALTELMSQLLGYFELHHGGRKVKGTMEVRQRAVWNTHT